MGLFALVGHQAQPILGRVGVDELFVEGHLLTPHKLGKAGEPSHKHLSLHIHAHRMLVACCMPHLWGALSECVWRYSLDAFNKRHELLDVLR